VASPIVTDSFIVTDEHGQEHGVIEVSRIVNDRERSLETSYWLGDGTLVERLHSALSFVNPVTGARFQLIGRA
jgi:hypothetical protein